MVFIILLYNLIELFFIKNKSKRKIGGLGIGDWGLGIGGLAQSPIPNPQSPIPNPPYKIYI
jgi:hypothetical protein